MPTLRTKQITSRQKNREATEARKNLQEVLQAQEQIFTEMEVLRARNPPPAAVEPEQMPPPGTVREKKAEITVKAKDVKWREVSRNDLPKYHAEHRVSFKRYQKMAIENSPGGANG